MCVDSSQASYKRIQEFLNGLFPPRVLLALRLVLSKLCNKLYITVTFIKKEFSGKLECCLRFIIILLNQKVHRLRISFFFIFKFYLFEF